MNPTIITIYGDRAERASKLEEINDLLKWRERPCSWIGRQHSKDVSSFKLMYIFNIIPIKISVISFVSINMIILKLIWKIKEAIITKIILK